jgi:hypothetical protein
VVGRPARAGNRPRSTPVSQLRRSPAPGQAYRRPGQPLSRTRRYPILEPVTTAEDAIEIPIPIKPHHFVDIITAFGDGVEAPPPHPYGHAVHTVTEAVLSRPHVQMRMELGADAICAPCRHNQAGVCDDRIDTSYRPLAPASKRDWNLRLDQRWCERLGLAAGQQLSALACCRLLQEKAGDITAIYAEEPAERTAGRQARLAAGIRRFLGAP